VLPFFHIYGMTALLNATLHGWAQLVVMPSFDLAAFLGCIAKHRCTIAFITPPIALALAKHPIVDDYDLSLLRALLSGAAPLDEALGRPVSRRIGCRVMQGYGMSELSPVSHGIPFDGGAELLGAEACRARVRTSAPASQPNLDRGGALCGGHFALARLYSFVVTAGCCAARQASQLNSLRPTQTDEAIVLPVFLHSR
jgi:acyl-CoA synthetase (AMP-forming)/AMP-acid ligase II